jgi:hypothetical protein
MRSRPTPKSVTLRIEPLEDRRVLSLLGLGSLLFVGPTGSLLSSSLHGLYGSEQNDSSAASQQQQHNASLLGSLTGLLRPLSSQVGSVVQSVAPTSVAPTLGSGIAEATTSGSLTQAIGTTPTPVAQAVTPVETVGSVGVESLRSLLAPSTPVTSVPVSVQHSAVVADAGVTRTSDTAGGLTASPSFQGAGNHLSPPPLEQATAGAVNGVATRLNTEPARVERNFIEASPGRDEFGAILREDRQGNIVFAAAVNDELPVDSLMSRQQPQEADLLTSALPADTPSLELGVQQFLSQLNDAGQELSRAMTRHGWLPWMLGAGLAGLAALEFARRQEQRRRRIGGRAYHDTLSWVPGLPGSLGFEDA